jgi:hypothetical protein
MKQEVRNFLRNLSNCGGIVQRCSFKLGNELVNIFRNASIGTTVKVVNIGLFYIAVFYLARRCNQCLDKNNASFFVVVIELHFF